MFSREWVLPSAIMKLIFYFHILIFCEAIFIFIVFYFFFFVDFFFLHLSAVFINLSLDHAIYLIYFYHREEILSTNCPNLVHTLLLNNR